ncbi:MAG TPA: glycosyltransferase family 4 protein [Longimicrobiales bacterium]|nr:glycosyltransferase family 4 protein [Longimicrobiales bacterium]
MAATSIDAASASVRAQLAPQLTAIVVGPLPPPYHGGAVATALVLEAGLGTQYRIVHLDTSDRRGIENLGRLDARNVWLGVSHALQLVRLLMWERPDLVYIPISQNTLALLRDATFLLPSLACRRRVVVHIHSGGFRDFHDAAPRPLRSLIRFMLGRARRVIVLGERLRPMVQGLVAAERIAVLPNGVADTFGALPNRSGRRAGARVLYLANLMRAKGFLDVMEAVLRLRRRGVDVELDLAGAFASADDRARARAPLAALGAAVRLHGVVDGERKRRLLEEADIFTLPSYYANEGHPYVVLEAMAAGLPVIATDRAALAETIVPGHTGLLVPPRDPAALADALDLLVCDPALRLRMGAAARERYLAHYTFDSWSAGLSDIMMQALR